MSWSTNQHELEDKAGQGFLSHKKQLSGDREHSRSAGPGQVCLNKGHVQLGWAGGLETILQIISVFRAVSVVRRSRWLHPISAHDFTVVI